MADTALGGTLLELLQVTGSPKKQGGPKSPPGCLYPLDLGVDLSGRCRHTPTSGAGLCSLHSCPHMSTDNHICGLEKDENQSRCPAHMCPHVSDSQVCGADKKSREPQCSKHSCLHLNAAENGHCGKDKETTAKFWYEMQVFSLSSLPLYPPIILISTSLLHVFHPQFGSLLCTH